MIARIACMTFALTALVLCTTSDAQEKKKRTGNVTGDLVSSKATPNGKNVLIEVLAQGEEKARSYRVIYDKESKGPLPKVLEAVRAAKVGDRVELAWVDTGEGLAITSFQVLKKAKDDKKDAPEKDKK
jgi:hypothetical protein